MRAKQARYYQHLLRRVIARPMGGVSVVGRSNPACSTTASFTPTNISHHWGIASLSIARATHSLAMTPWSSFIKQQEKFLKRI